MFCFKCGAQIPDESVFCSKCGTKVQTSPEPAAQTYAITFDRASQVYVANPPIKIVIDGEIRLSVDNGRTERVDLAPGHHKIELSGSIRSTKVDVDLQRDTIIKISFSRLTGKLVAEVI